ncbi:DUF2182 domain-containing protein [Natrialba taiwanensis]|uniref:Metal-binding integral membrane protein-like protein n=1 Tax=Natrialba taiwanensis DSM 12281 TaxID=1230458 RepID=L9ZS90_9EURY|nr:DUF2182 domain-containing protein [Natrialba taiwanensis]ELY88951.1 hypothetical protein C484_15198 [Natrialba taiwanensis DSM 12281]
MLPDNPLSFTTRIDSDSLPIAELTTLSLSALLWLILFEGWLPNLGPAPAELAVPMAAPGVPEAMATANGLSGTVAYLLMWGTMMLAMMLPSLIPVVRQHLDDVCQNPSVAVPSIAGFLGGYGLVWTAIGAVPLAVELLVSIHEFSTASAFGLGAGTVPVAGLLAFAGGYQLTPFKRRVLSRCASCQSIPHCPNVNRMVRRGISYATNCVACTWPLFALMVALGSMNFLVMVSLTLVVSIERLTPDGERVAFAVGVLLIGAAVFSLLFGVPTV